MILSLASSKSFISTTRPLRRAAKRAASLTRLARSAPEKPGVPRAITSGCTSAPIGTFFMCTLRICSRPRMSGSGTTTWRSKRPGRIKRGIEHVGTVGCGNDDDVGAGFKAVHFNEHLVERLLALVVAAAKTCAALAAHRIDFVDEDDAGGVLLGVFKHVAHARRAHAHEHFHEVRARNREKRHAGFAGNGLGKQRLAGAGRPTSRMPRGIWPPRRWNCDGSRRKSTTSCTSSLASSHPATSAKRTLLARVVKHARLALAEGKRARSCRPASDA